MTEITETFIQTDKLPITRWSSISSTVIDTHPDLLTKIIFSKMYEMHSHHLFREWFSTKQSFATVQLIALNCKYYYSTHTNWNQHTVQSWIDAIEHYHALTVNTYDNTSITDDLDFNNITDSWFYNVIIRCLLYGNTVPFPSKFVDQYANIPHDRKQGLLDFIHLTPELMDQYAKYDFSTMVSTPIPVRSEKIENLVHKSRQEYAENYDVDPYEDMDTVDDEGMDTVDPLGTAELLVPSPSSSKYDESVSLSHSSNIRPRKGKEHVLSRPTNFTLPDRGLDELAGPHNSKEE